MSDLNLPDKDDAPWLDTTYDGFMTGAELGFNAWFNYDTYGLYSHRCEWFFDDCEVEDVKTRKDLLYKWIHAAYCAGYSQNTGMKELADD
jgi:hypothetical protein